MMVNRDARSLWQTISDPNAPHAKALAPFLPLDRDRLVLALGASALGYAALPQLGAAFVALAAASVAIRLHHDRTSKKTDPLGIMHMGDDRSTGRPFHLDRDGVRQHTLVLGDTGAGKTEALLGLAENALHWQSGFLFVDGKGDVALAHKVMSMARAHGRANDVIVLNPMAGNVDDADRSTNSMNPYAKMAGKVPVLDLGEILDPFPGNGKHQADLFIALVSQMVGTLFAPTPTLAAKTAEERTSLLDLVSMAERTDDRNSKAALDYLASLPGFDIDRGSRQSATVGDLHSSIRDWAAKGLRELSIAWSPLMRDGSSDVDMVDVVLNRRILLVTLPALERGSPTVPNNGQIMVARTIVQALRHAMSALLPKAQGAWNEIVEQRSPTGHAPFLVVLDDLSLYARRSLGLTMAQARSLGIGMILSDESIQRIKQVGGEAAHALDGGTATKIFMRHESMEGGRPFAPLDPSRDVPLKPGEMTLIHRGEIHHLLAPYPKHSLGRIEGRAINQFLSLEEGAPR